MSPLTLRRYRAERLLRRDFELLRRRVLDGVQRRLRAGGVSLDRADLEECYAIAWQGLYARMLEGREVDNPAAWLGVVTFRRAVDEHRSQRRARTTPVPLVVAGGARADGAATEVAHPTERVVGGGGDLAAELDDRLRLRQLFEGLRGRLSAREREAATLCYLQGLTRAEAAARMGISEARMRKLMEGQGPLRPGVAAKMGSLLEVIRRGEWCQEQGSTMRALAFGILDPGGERHRLAALHVDACPSCRAYVTSLRGLAAALPPVLLPGGLAAEALARALHGAAAPSAAGLGVGPAGRIGGGVPASGAAGAGAGGATGGGWLLAGGGLTTKLAVGCVLAVGLGAGCVALEHGGRAQPPRTDHAQPPRVAIAARSAIAPEPSTSAAVAAQRAGVAHAPHAPAASAPLTPVARAAREFGPEAGTQASLSESRPAGDTADAASAASAERPSASPSPQAQAEGAESSTQGGGGEDAEHATREFAPG